MEFTQIKGNTWAFHGVELLPVYLLGDGNCILFDTGFPDERTKIENALAQKNLTPKAIFCTHAHVDHVGSCAYLQKKYKIPLYMSPSEAGLMSSVLSMKAYRITVSPQEAKKLIEDCVTEEVTLIHQSQTSVIVENIEILVYRTPGHSCDHLCFATPDSVCYLGDALLTEDQMDAKLPYALDIAGALQSQQKIPNFPEEIFVMAHKGCCHKEDIHKLTKQNQDLFLKVAQNIRHCAGMGKTIDQLTMDYCREYKLATRKPKTIAHYQRNIRFFLEYLEDKGDISMEIAESGVLWKSTLQ